MEQFYEKLKGTNFFIQMSANETTWGQRDHVIIFVTENVGDDKLQFQR